MLEHPRRANEMTDQFDLVVVGTGSGGSTPARRCRAAGWRVAVIDDQPYGGTCTLRGCDPKKVLVGVAELVDWYRRMVGHGVVGAAQLDWPALQRFKRTFTDPVPAAQEAALQHAGIATYHGHARFVSDRRLMVGDDVLEANHFVIATGARPRPLGIAGEEHLRTSTDFLALEELPARIAFVGAGYISFEFAHIVQRAGTQAIVIGRGSPLARFDQTMVEQLIDHSRSVGIDVRTHAEVTRLERRDSIYYIHVATPGGADVVEADLVVHGAGRIPDTDGLGAAEAHIALDERGAVRVNEYLQSVSNARVYAAGDAVLPAGSLPLTPVAAHEGHVVASNLLHGNAATPDYGGVPSVVFTIPPLASVGLTEAEARRQGRRVRVACDQTGTWYSNRRIREHAGAFKTIVEDGTDRVLGAHVFGPLPGGGLLRPPRGVPISRRRLTSRHRKSGRAPTASG